MRIRTLLVVTHDSVSGTVRPVAKPRDVIGIASAHPARILVEWRHSGPYPSPSQLGPISVWHLDSRRRVLAGRSRYLFRIQGRLPRHSRHVRRMLRPSRVWANPNVMKGGHWMGSLRRLLVRYSYPIRSPISRSRASGMPWDATMRKSILISRPPSSRHMDSTHHEMPASKTVRDFQPKLDPLCRDLKTLPCGLTRFVGSLFPATSRLASHSTIL